jgi:NAD(P)-dependent dehydrogenase (short-subunit alcohol dehydrogenase family)
MANIVIAGASRGIGLTLVKAYAADGDTVYALCRDPAGADKLNSAAEGNGAIKVIAADLGDGASVDRAAAAIGDAPVDLLINVAGIYRNETGPEDRNFDGWRESFEVMTIGPFRMTQALLPNLERAKGKVVSISSQIGASTWPMGAMYSYGAAKAALNRVMKSLSIDLKDRGVAVAVVHPGYVQTDMGGPGADITPEESAQGIRAVADRLTLETTGSFSKWNGEPHPW